MRIRNFYQALFVTFVAVETHIVAGGKSQIIAVKRRIFRRNTSPQQQRQQDTKNTMLKFLFQKQSINASIKLISSLFIVRKYG